MSDNLLKQFVNEALHILWETILKETKMRQYECDNTPPNHYIDQGHCDGQGVYCCLNTASKMSPIFTSLLH